MFVIFNIFSVQNLCMFMGYFLQILTRIASADHYFLLLHVHLNLIRPIELRSQYFILNSTKTLA
jgi:hypothetical protein